MTVFIGHGPAVARLEGGGRALPALDNAGERRGQHWGRDHGNRSDPTPQIIDPPELADDVHVIARVLATAFVLVITLMLAVVLLGVFSTRPPSWTDSGRELLQPILAYPTNCADSAEGFVSPRPAWCQAVP
jgi:hypothetical protein